MNTRTPRPLPSGRPPRRAPRGAGYGPGGPPKPVWLRAAYQPSPRRPRPAERPLQPRPGLGALDARLPRQPVHRPMAPRAGQPVDASDAQERPPPWPNTWGRSAMPRRGSIRQHVLLRLRQRARSAGFAEYHDYLLTVIEAIRTVYLLDAALDAIEPLEPVLDRWLSIGLGSVMADRSVRQLTHTDQKTPASSIANYLDWLDRRRESRPPVLRLRQLRQRPCAFVLPAGGGASGTGRDPRPTTITCSSSTSG